MPGAGRRSQNAVSRPSGSGRASPLEYSRDKSKIFFNTRIVRVTESLMFASSLYKTLSVAPETSHRPGGAQA